MTATASSAKPSAALAMPCTLGARITLSAFPVHPSGRGGQKRLLTTPRGQDWGLRGLAWDIMNDSNYISMGNVSAGKAGRGGTPGPKVTVCCARLACP